MIYLKPSAATDRLMLNDDPTGALVLRANEATGRIELRLPPLYLVANGADRVGFDGTGPAVAWLVPSAAGRLALNDVSTGAVKTEYNGGNQRVELKP